MHGKDRSFKIKLESIATHLTVGETREINKYQDSHFFFLRCLWSSPRSIPIAELKLTQNDNIANYEIPVPEYFVWKILTDYFSYHLIPLA